MIIRTYRCDDCLITFEVTCESNDGDPDCPNCTRVLDWVPTRFAIATEKSVAVNVTQKIIEQDYGLTDFKDNLREGDIAAKTPIRTTAEREAIEKIEKEARELQINAHTLAPQTKQFWGGSHPQQVNVAAAALADVKAAKGEHIGMDVLRDMGKRGELNMPIRVIAKG